MPVKLTLKNCQDYALEKGGKCLSDKYIKTTIPMKWECLHNHIFEKSFKSVRKGVWCPVCKGLITHSLKECKQFAKDKGGDCLSNEYNNSKFKMEWICGKCNYIWKAQFTHLFNNNSWCPNCAKKAQLTLKEVQEYAISKGGECLSKIYINNNTPMKFKCGIMDCKYEWEVSYGGMKHQKNWCPKCAKKAPINIKEIHEYANKKGGICLSKTYNNKNKVSFKCNKNHIWDTFYVSAKSANSWCPVCSSGGNASKKGIEWLKSVEYNRNIILQYSGKGGEKKINIPEYCQQLKHNHPKSQNYFKYGIYENYFKSIEQVEYCKDINYQTKYYIDGFHNETNTIYEYHSKFFHGADYNKYIHTDLHPLSGVPMGIIFKRSIYKEIILKRMGYKYICGWGP